MSENNSYDEEKIDNDTTKFLYAFTQSILNSDNSIRWVAITDRRYIYLDIKVYIIYYIYLIYLFKYILYIKYIRYIIN